MKVLSFWMHVEIRTTNTNTMIHSHTHPPIPPLTQTNEAHLWVADPILRYCLFWRAFVWGRLFIQTSALLLVCLELNQTIIGFSYKHMYTSPHFGPLCLRAGYRRRRGAGRGSRETGGGGGKGHIYVFPLKNLFNCAILFFLVFKAGIFADIKNRN